MSGREPGWPMFQKVWRREKLIERMIVEMGIEPGVAVRLDHGAAYCEACAKCLACTSQAECRAWLEEADRLPVAPEVCPNDAFFERCLAQQKKLCPSE